MGNSTSQFDPESGGRFSRPRAFRDIFIVGCPLILLGGLGNAVGLGTLEGGAIIHLGYVLMIVVGGFLLAYQGSGWRELGLGKPKSLPETLLLGLATFVAAVFVFVLTQALAIFLVTTLDLVPAEIDQSRFNAMEGNLPFFILALILAWTTIAFGEEMFFRAFLITRMIDYTMIKPAPAVLIAGVIFSAAHFAEGPMGVLSNGAFGVLFGWIYLRYGRNLWITVISHGLMNSLRFFLLYMGAV